METIGHWFVDEYKRRLILHGVNLGGSSKVPYKPDGATHIQEGFYEHRNVSFVGRPFPLQEAAEHFERLKTWGLRFLRLLVTWEAVEHAGPGQYDEDYLNYLEAIVEKAHKFGIKLFIDPHQDMWSRFSGGDGAPGWTLEIVGFEITKLHQTGAAFLHQIHGDPLPAMIWPTNSTKLAAATMFTLFFAGEHFTPQFKIDGENIQEFLQRHYIQAMKQIAQRLKNHPNNVGFDTMNEPLQGYIGWHDLSQAHAIVELGAIPSPFQSMLLADGIPQEVDIWERGILGPKKVSRAVLNPEGERAWLPDRGCIWRQHGVWDVDNQGNPQLLKPDYFSKINGKPVDFNHDCYMPFNRRFAREIRSVHQGTLIFIEHALEAAQPELSSEIIEKLVYAPHWYDAATLFLKRYSRWMGFDQLKKKIIISPRIIQTAFREHIKSLKMHAIKNMGDIPTIIGETGIPFDMQSGQAFRDGDFSSQIKAMQRTLEAMDANLMSYTLWNYTADNSNLHGDNWNGEDLSIFSRDQQTNPENIHSGGRALEAVVRPYAIATAGTPLSMTFELRKKLFRFIFQDDPEIEAPTLIFVPRYQYPQGFRVILSDGSYTFDQQEQVLSYYPAQRGERHKIEIKPLK